MKRRCNGQLTLEKAGGGECTSFSRNQVSWGEGCWRESEESYISVLLEKQEYNTQALT